MADTIGTRFGDGGKRWTEDDDALLLRCIKAGFSYGRISRLPQINRSRSAVSGRVYRIRRGRK